MAEKRETESRETEKREKRGITWANQNRIREFKYNSTVGQNTVNSSRPSQPGPSIDLPERTFNPVRNAGLTLRPQGVKQTMPSVPGLASHNTRRNTNRSWSLAKRIMKQQMSANRRPLSHTEFNAAVQGYHNEEEAKKSKENYENPQVPRSAASMSEPWYKDVQPEYGPALLGTSTSLWQSASRPRVNTSGGKRRKTKRNTKRNNHKK